MRERLRRPAMAFLIMNSLKVIITQYIAEEMLKDIIGLIGLDNVIFHACVK